MRAPDQTLRRPNAVAGVVVAFTGVALVGYYLATSHRLADGFFLPLDDAYIYLTYAKQIARGAPFTYFDGSGYSAGATSALWPWLLAPLWGLGMRSDTFALGASMLGGATYVATLVVGCRVAKRLASTGASDRSVPQSLLAPAIVLGSGPLAWGCLSGMEVGLVALSLVSTTALFLSRTDAQLHERGLGRPLTLALAALALSRPEAACVVVLLCVHGAVVALLARRWSVLTSWLAPVAPFAVWLVANRIGAGHFVPNTAVAKSALYLPGFTWASHAGRVLANARDLFAVLFVQWNGPLGAGPLVLVFDAVGVFGILRSTALRSHRTASWFVVLAAPVYACAMLVSSSAWVFQHQRYISGAYALVLVVAACGAIFLVRALAPRVQVAIAVAFTIATVARAAPRHRDEALLLAQGARDVRDQVVRVGRFVDGQLPFDARIAIHDVGAIGYYGHRPLFDVVGLVTNRQAQWCNNGPGTRFESLERIPIDARPTHFAYYPGWLLAGPNDMFGAVLLEAKLSAPLLLSDDVKPRLVGGDSMLVMEANWDLAGSGDRPMLPYDGWRMVDALDVADLASETEHGYARGLAEARIDDRNERFSCYLQAPDQGDSSHRIADGGRTIPAGSDEHFVLRTPKDSRLRIVLRTGGPPRLPLSEIGEGPRSLDLVDAGDRVLGQFRVPAPNDRFAELTIDLPRDFTRTNTTAFIVRGESPATSYRSFHYFVLEEQR